MKIIDLEQGSPEWLEWRRSHICASDIAIIAGVSPWSYPEELWRQKKGLQAPNAMTDAMRRGVELEDTARRAVSFKIDGDYKPRVVEHEKEPWAGASLDGYDEETDTILEIKCPGATAFKRAVKGYIPLVYLYQIYWQMYVSGASKAYYACYYEGDLQIIGWPPKEEDGPKRWHTFVDLMADSPTIHAKARQFHELLKEDTFQNFDTT